jgi:hypothetical protein
MWCVFAPAKPTLTRSERRFPPAPCYQWSQTPEPTAIAIALLPELLRRWAEQSQDEEEDIEFIGIDHIRFDARFLSGARPFLMRSPGETVFFFFEPFSIRCECSAVSTTTP